MRRSSTVLISQLPVAECKRRLEEAAETDVLLIGDMKLRYGILANIEGDRFQLRVRHALVRNSISPRLEGDFREEPGATLIELRTKTSRMWRLWAIAATVLTACIAIVALADLSRGHAAGSWMPMAFSLFFLALLACGFISARKDHQDLIRFVEWTLDAVSPDTERPNRPLERPGMNASRPSSHGSAGRSAPSRSADRRRRISDRPEP